MGLTSSPRIFTKVLKPVFTTLRTHYGHNCLGYIDDSFYTEESENACREATLHAVQLFTRLGFVIHRTKSVFSPTQSLEFLGFQLSSMSMTVRLTNKKGVKIVDMCQKFLRGHEFSIREIASIIGTLVATFPGVEFGPLYYRNLEHEKDAALKAGFGDFEQKMSLGRESIEELKWWVTSIPTAFRKIDHGIPTITLTSDASHMGWGATTVDNETQGLWTQHESDCHINILEMRAVELGLMSLLDTTSNQHIRIMSDNITTVTYINAMGGCKSEECNHIAKRIWLWAIHRNNWLSAAHIPGHANVTADFLSRHFNDGIEWQLDACIFHKICQSFGVPSIDLFASRINHHTNMYVSWKQDPYATYVDAFTVNWNQFELSYAFPPFCLVARCLQKIASEKATTILIVPAWTTQSWFTMLLSMLIDQPMIISVKRNTLSHPVKGNIHPLSPQLRLMACKVSGNNSLSTTFQATLPMLSCVRGEQERKNNMMYTSKSGRHFVLKKKLIHCSQV